MAETISSIFFSCRVFLVACRGSPARNVAVSFLEFVFCFVPKGFHSGALSRRSVNTDWRVVGVKIAMEEKSAINFASFVIWRNNRSNKIINVLRYGRFGLGNLGFPPF